MIIDEEQRFGVAQKELLRQLRLEVDVLALSAKLPILRTLHMSLSGLRDISVIETPPRGSPPDPDVRQLGEYDEEVITQALERELNREGRSVLPAQPGRHDRGRGRESCGSCCRRRACSSPTASWRSASSGTGCSRSSPGDADVLVSTTIIESGLDIPQANTLIVERADALRASRSSTRSAAGWAAGTSRRTPTCSIRRRPS